MGIAPQTDPRSLLDRHFYFSLPSTDGFQSLDHLLPSNPVLRILVDDVDPPERSLPNEILNAALMNRPSEGEDIVFEFAGDTESCVRKVLKELKQNTTETIP